MKDYSGFYKLRRTRESNQKLEASTDSLITLNSSIAQQRELGVR